jgi:glycosyltransferase involved in cell wall biosynthesis
MRNLTLIILTYNEEKNIAECIDSCKELDLNIFVVDSFSSDNTLQILKNHNIVFVQHPFDNYSHQRNWAQQNNPFKTEWVFHLDAGERFTPELIKWLKTAFNPTDASADGYMFSRRTMIFGKELRFGGQYPNFHLRLFRGSKGKCEDKLYDQHFIVNGPIKAVKKRVDIIDTVLESWNSFIAAHNRWALLEAIDIMKRNYRNTGEVELRFLGTPIERRRWLKNNLFQKTPLFLRAILYFLYRYFIRFGFLDGKTGLTFYFMQSFWFRFLIDANLLEIRSKLPKYNFSLQKLVQQEYGEKYLKLLED